MDDLIDGDTMIAELNKQVQVAARKPADGLSIVKYYDIASQLERQAKMYLADSDMERAYVMFFRFSSFFLTTIAAYKSYKDSEFTKIKTEYRQKCDESLKQCETLKKEIKDKYDGLVMAHAEKRLADLTLVRHDWLLYLLGTESSCTAIRSFRSSVGPGPRTLGASRRGC